MTSTIRDAIILFIQHILVSWVTNERFVKTDDVSRHPHRRGGLAMHAGGGVSKASIPSGPRRPLAAGPSAGKLLLRGRDIVYRGLPPPPRLST